MRLFALPNKKVIRFKNHAVDFLNAYTSNTIGTGQNAFVNIRGQIVCVFDQMFISPEKVLVVIEGQFLSRLKTHLDPYLQLGETVMEEAPEFHIYFDLESLHEPRRGDMVINQKKGQLIGVPEVLQTNVSDQEFALLRLKNGLPVQGVDYDQELLLNLGDEELISYTKGCYLGQEVIAKVHYRGIPPKKLVVKAVSHCHPDEELRMTSKTFDPVSSQTFGFLFVQTSGDSYLADRTT